MPYALNLAPDPDAFLRLERIFASLGGLGIGEDQHVTHYGPCVTILIVDDGVHPDDVLEILRRHVPRAQAIPLHLTEPCIIQGSPPTLSLRASPVQGLLDLHSAIYRSLPEQAVHLHYRPAYWQPHLKLANVSVDPEAAGKLVAAMAATWAPLRGQLVAVEAIHYMPVEAIWHGRLQAARES